ncbi:MAG: hypothetical protein Q9173_005647 [Seirophora scorigena]
MVLQDLGRRINSAVSDLTRSPNLDEKAFDNMIREICSALLEADVNVKLVGSLRKSIKATVNFKDIPPAANKKRLIQKAVFDELVKLVDPHAEPFKPKKGKPNVIMFVGLQGAGKTTTCTKLARHYHTRGFKSCLVCADTFRAGAFDQLKQNATKAKIPYFGSLTSTDPAQVAAEGVAKFKKERFEIIIVDTSGRHRQEKDLFDEMTQIQAAVKPDQTIMVLDATIGQQAEAQSKAFKETADYGAIIITKTDGHASGGGAISAVAATHTPIAFMGTGEHMLDLERFSPQPFVSKLLGMGDMAGLVEHVQALKLDQKDTMKHLAEGVFTVRDLRDQLQNIMKMGPLSKMAGMIPGLGQMMGGMDDEQGSMKMKRMIYICDSMTNKELDSDGKMFVEQPSRMTRVARGSGTSVREVEELLSQQKVMAGMAKKVGGMQKNMQKAQGAMGGNNRQQQMAAMQKRMQAMGQGGAGGGAGGLADMMKMMGGMGGGGGGGAGGGMPDMNAMMKMMGNLGGMGGMGGGPAGGRGGRSAASNIICRRKEDVGRWEICEHRVFSTPLLDIRSAAILRRRTSPAPAGPSLLNDEQPLCGTAMETSALSGVNVTNIIAQMRSLSGSGDVPEDSCRILLQSAKELQHSLETPMETCDRLHYSLFDILVKLADAPMSTSDLANETKTDPTLLGKYAASNGFVKQKRQLQQRYAAICRPPPFPRPDELPELHRQHRTVAQLTRSTSLHYFDWMKQNPEHYEALNKAMAANRLAKTGIDAFPFEDRFRDLYKKDQTFESSTPLLVDIGGGRGQMSRAFSKKCPHVPGRIVFQDLPQALANVPPTAPSSEASSSSSIEPMAHDFFQPQPITGARIYYLRHVLHDWPDKEAELILKNTVEAMRGHDSSLLIEREGLTGHGGVPGGGRIGSEHDDNFCGAGEVGEAVARLVSEGWVEDRISAQIQ